MFAYCLNNPVNGVDYGGDKTYTIGGNVAVVFLGGISYSLFLSVDDSGGVAIQYSKADVTRTQSGGYFGLVNASAGGFYSKTSLDTVDDLEGFSTNVGGSYGVMGYSKIYKDVFGEERGKSYSCSASTAKGEVHVEISETETLMKFNLIESANNAFDKIISYCSFLFG